MIPRSIALLAACFASPFVSTHGAQSAIEASTPRPHLVAMAQLPTAIASFGAIRLGDWIYIAGGHIGTEHTHSVDNLSSRFTRFHVDDPQALENLPGGVALQGFNLAADANSVIRVGGLFAKNEDPFFEELVSVRGVDRFDPETSVWTSLPPLPEPRSSHDALVVDDVLYVVGGWQLNADEEPKWHDHGWTMDLGEASPSWTKLSTPFRRRALSIGVQDGQLLVTGGLTDSGRPTSETELYDIASGLWTDGPDFPGWGFGTATTSLNGQLCVGGLGGAIWGLAPDRSAWSPVATSVLPRFFHRLLPGRSGLIALGGATREGHTGWIERIEPRGIATMSVALPDSLRDSRQLVSSRGQVLLAGEHGAGWVDLLTGECSEAMDSIAGFEICHFAASPAAAGVCFKFMTVNGETKISRFSDDTGLWEAVGSQVGLPAEGFAVSFHGDCSYVLGGRFGATKTDVASDRVFVAPAAMDEHFAPADFSLPEPMRAFASAVLGDGLYLIGGIGTDGQLVTTFHTYNFESREWSILPAAPRHQSASQMIGIDKQLYLFSGDSAADSSSATLEAYDTKSRSWRTVVAQLPFTAEGMRMSVWGERLIFQSVAPETNQALIHVVDPRSL